MDLMRTTLGGVVALLAVGLLGCGDAGEPQPVGEGGTARPAVSSEASRVTGPEAAPQGPESLPVVDAAALKRIVAENAAAGKVTVIDFWATWCVPCVALFPELHASLHAMGDVVAPISVTIDSPGKYEQQAIAFLKEQDAMAGAYIIAEAADEQERVIDELGERWNDFVVPAILVFDREGKLAGEFLGNVEAQPAKIVERVRELSPASPPAAEIPPPTEG